MEVRRINLVDHPNMYFTALTADMNKSTKLDKTKTAPQNNQISQAKNKEDSHTKSTERSQKAEEK